MIADEGEECERAGIDLELFCVKHPYSELR